MNKKAIVYTVDDNIDCLLQLTASLKSVRVFQPENYDVYILTNQPRAYLSSMYGAKIVDVSKFVEEYGLDETGIIWRKKPVSPMLLFRLLIPIIPELQPYDQILYLDTDTEVWNTEFFTIFSKDYNCDIIGVRDSLSCTGASYRLKSLRENGKEGWRDPPGIFNRWDELIQRRGKYANSGVLVFNMKNIREGYEDRIRYVVDRIKELKPYYSDQDSLNVYFRIYVVDDRKYNNWGHFVTDTFLFHYVGTERRRASTYPPQHKFRPNELLNQRVIDESHGILRKYIDKIYVIESAAQQYKDSLLQKWMLSNRISSFELISPSDKDFNMDPAFTSSPEKTIQLLQHYSVMRDALQKGYDHIAVFESTFNLSIKPGELDALGDMPYDFVRLSGQNPVTPTSILYASSKNLLGYIISKKCMIYTCKTLEESWGKSDSQFYKNGLIDWYRSINLKKMFLCTK